MPGHMPGLIAYEARKRVLEDLREQGFLVGEKDYTVALGKCDRCGTVVEPRLSTQWFMKIQPLAERAIEVVEKDYIRFTPANYRPDLSELDAQHSRLEHLAAVVVGPPDSGVALRMRRNHRRAGDAEFCPKCGGSKSETRSGCSGHLVLIRPAAVYIAGLAGSDARSGSLLSDVAADYWLRHFIFLGRAHDHAGLLVHGAAGKARRLDGRGAHRSTLDGFGGTGVSPVQSQSDDELRDTVPFREVYIHALVRDAERQKMSKTKGNVLDPIQVIEKYGTDATRFTLAAMSSPGTDIAFNEKRTEGYRAFANKIWNAARFMFMNIERIDPGLQPKGTAEGARSHTGVAGFQAATLEDRWILSRFNSVTKNVNDSLAAYRFDEAANAIYDFFWGEFCDWYLELIKPRLLPEVRKCARHLR